MCARVFLCVACFTKRVRVTFCVNIPSDTLEERKHFVVLLYPMISKLLSVKNMFRNLENNYANRLFLNEDRQLFQLRLNKCDFLRTLIFTSKLSKRTFHENCK